MRLVTLICLTALMMSGAGCISLDLKSLLSPSLEEVVVHEGPAKTKILLIDVHGLIKSGQANEGFSLIPATTPDSIRAVLDHASKDPAIKAVVLRIDTPGGDVTASDVIYHELASFRQRSGLPMLASVMGLGASGGYYVACAADSIHVHPTSIVGSIGVIAVFPKLRAMADKVGYDQQLFKSGDMKDMGSVLKDMAPEEQAIVQGIVESMYQRFLKVVAQARPALRDETVLRPIADGRVYTADQALANGLVDGIAYLPEVLDAAKAAAGVDKARVVTYVYGGNSDATIYSSSATGKRPLVEGFTIDLGLLNPSTRAGFLYLWSPGSP